MTERPYLSIGEVLALLLEEFPDVTISKIRFLESQGLVNPERTPSGYRKFYDGDIERLRWILRQQREKFLPLKVIKDRLRDPDSLGEGAAPRAEPDDTARDPEALSVPATPTPARPRVTLDSRLDAGPTGASLTLEELSAAAGMSAEQVAELEQFGLVKGRSVGTTTLYDEEALTVARLAAGFLRFGVEARHLRMYRTGAEREAAFFEQVVLPLVKQRNPTARRQATEALSELAALGESLRAAMLRRALRSYTDRL